MRDIATETGIREMLNTICLSPEQRSNTTEQNSSVNDNYTLFLKKKSQMGSMGGFAPTFMPNFLFDFQAATTTWGIEKGRAALFEDCGLGKTIQQLVWAQNVVEHTNKPVLILTPLAVSFQTVDEAEKFGIEAVRHLPGQSLTSRIYVTNYERLHHLDSTQFGGVVADECFPAGTLVDTPSGRYAIETLSIGAKILNASGIDTISDIHRREVPYAIALTIHQNARIICSPHHPIFTERGWVCAQDLEPGDALLHTETAMRMVRGDISSRTISNFRSHEILREILLSELANESTTISGKTPHNGSSSQESPFTIGMVYGGVVRSESSNRARSQIEPYDRSSSAREGFNNSQTDASQTFNTRREWTRAYSATDNFDGCVRSGMEIRIERIVGEQNSGLSDIIQTGLRQCGTENWHRSGWVLSLQPESVGCKEGCKTGFVRVDRLEILEQGHPELERCRASDGKLYFYDLTATRHPSFSVNGLLVHNSSRIKAFDSQTCSAVIDFMRHIDYRLLCTATAAPNDYPEFGTSAEALSVVRRVDMLHRYFTHDSGDTGKWRLKKHATRAAFWQWMGSWARAIRSPSDLGFSDEGFILPPLIEQQHVIRSSVLRDDLLFSIEAIGLAEQRAERRVTITERCEKVAELINPTGKPAIAWCHLNPEGDLLEKLIPDAIQVSGKDSDEAKEEKLLAFTHKQSRVLIIKPKIGAHGLNLQHCAHMTTFSSHSFEDDYQQVRRCYRFGQQSPVTVDRIVTEGEQRVIRNLQRKAKQAEAMYTALIQAMRETVYQPQVLNKIQQIVATPSWL